MCLRMSCGPHGIHSQQPEGDGSHCSPRSRGRLWLVDLLNIFTSRRRHHQRHLGVLVRCEHVERNDELLLGARAVR